MGYRPNRKVFTLQFEKPEMEGLEVRATSVSTGAFLEIVTMADTARADVSQMRTLFEEFANQSLRSWNVENDDGTPVPATLEGMLSQEFDFVFDIISSWMDVMTSVSPPLEMPSSDGNQSPVVSLPMEPLSGNPAS